jgi:hypothetical protein
LLGLNVLCNPFSEGTPFRTLEAVGRCAPTILLVLTRPEM